MENRVSGRGSSIGSFVLVLTGWASFLASAVMHDPIWLKVAFLAVARVLPRALSPFSGVP
jgi:hypothetical protein